MKRLVIATVVGAVVAFCWGAVSWMLIGWHEPEAFEDGAAVAGVIAENAPTHGIYMLPEPGGGGEEQSVRMTKGPFVYAVVRPGSLDSPWSIAERLLRSFAINLACCLVIAVAVLRIRATRYISRASVGAAMGVFAVLSVVLPQWNWFETPGRHLLAAVLDPVAAYTLAGLAVAAIIKPPRARRIFS